MEKIAIISDIHGNITALDTVLEDIKSRGITRIFCLGDMIVKCSSPYECVEKVLEKCEVVLKGNCEERVVEDPKIYEHIWNREKLTDKQKETIKRLPLYHDFYMSGYKVRLLHASPNTIHQRANFWNFDDEFSTRMDEMFKNTEYLGNIGSENPDIVIFGHIHKPLIIRHGNKTIINPGAISNTSDMININGKDYTYGSYLILEGEYGNKNLDKISYKIVKFVYNHMQEAQKILNSDMPNKESAYTEITTGKYFSRRKIEEEMGLNNGKNSHNI